MKNALRQEVGQLFVVGLGGPVLEPAERAWLRLLRPGGVILFRRNIEDARQTAALLREATEAAASPEEPVPALRAVDLEGGLVDRLRDLLAPMPSPALAAAAGAGARHGQLIGRACRLLGFNTPFAPVLDLGLPASAPVLRSRAAGASAEAVVRYAEPFLQGLRGERVLGCGKHFPGLGSGTLDSHHETPRISRGWKRLWEEDLLPYRRLLSLLPIIMAAHALYPRVREAGRQPASVSPFWITEILRKQLGYGGLILTDDMEMGGLLTRMRLEDAAVGAVLAGVDLLEVCKEPALIFRAYEAVLGEAERSPAFARCVRRAAVRVVEQKRRLLDTQLPRMSTPEQIGRLRGDILKFAAQLEGEPQPAMTGAAE